MNQLFLHLLNSLFNRTGVNDRDRLHREVGGTRVEWPWAVAGICLFPLSIFLIWLFMH